MNVVNVYVPGIYHEGDAYLMVVLTDDAVGSMAVYIGVVVLKDPTDLEERADAAVVVAHQGSKQNYRQALAYFPTLAEKEYRP